tara:strand:+ start:51 stop:632 length:582 start_codon:yes stop_codon:yes gene_type:complete
MTWVSDFPSVVTAGSTLNWEDASATVGFNVNATSADWTLTYYLRTNAAGEGATVVGSAYNDGWRFTVASSVTTGFDRGNWVWAAVISKGSESYELAKGDFKVIQSLIYTGTPAALDNRTDNEKARDNIKTALSKFADGAQEYSVGGRSYKRASIPDLHIELNRLNEEIFRESDAEKIKQGLGSGRRFYVRFGA